MAAWRGVVELVNSNDLTHASIAYYALLSFFPFLLLVFSLLGSITDNQEDRIAVLTFVFRYFPTKLDFVTGQLDAMNRTSVRLVLPARWRCCGRRLVSSVRSRAPSTKPGASSGSGAGNTAWCRS